MAATVGTERDIHALRREKEAALLSLGKVMHKRIRDGEVTDAPCVRLSERIGQIDAQLCVAEGARVPGQDEGVCPNCGAAQTDPMAVFCGSCGTNISEFYARDTRICEICGQLTSAAGEYCTVCGSRGRTKEG